MLTGHHHQRLSFLIKENDLDLSSQEFIDSYEEEFDENGNGNGIDNGIDNGEEFNSQMNFEKWTEVSGTIVLKDSASPAPCLESILQNLSLDQPTLSRSRKSPDLELVRRKNKNSINLNSWLSSAFQWEPTNRNNLVIDEGSTETRPLIIYVSKMKLIEKLTTVLDYKLMDDILLTIEMIMHPMDFATCLLSRLAQAFNAVPGWNSEESIDREVVKMRGLIVLQHWTEIQGVVDGERGGLCFSVRKIAIEALDFIWQQSRILSQSDQRFLIKIRRLFDPRGEISISSNTPEYETDNETTIPEEVINVSSSNSSVFDSESFISTGSAVSLKWREKLKLRIKSIFSSSTLHKKRLSNSQTSSSLLINSFSSDAECEEVSSVILTERSRNLATILAVLESDLFQAIPRAELVVFPIARESPQRLAEECPNLQRSIEHFNSMCQWFVQLISLHEGPGKLLAKLIRLAVKCVLIHNYNSALQIILSLQSPAVAARTDLWAALPTWERRLAKDLAVFGSPIKNFRNVRKSLEGVYGEDVSVVPFNGLFLSDLVFNWERTNSNSQDPCDSKIIPFYKNHLAAKIVRQFLEFQHPRHQFQRTLTSKERQLYSYFADIGRLGGEFSV